MIILEYLNVIIDFLNKPISGWLFYASCFYIGWLHAKQKAVSRRIDDIELESFHRVLSMFIEKNYKRG